MFNRQKQPIWLRVANLSAVLALSLVVFVDASSRPIWFLPFLVTLFVIIAAMNFAIHFQDAINLGSRAEDQHSDIKQKITTQAKQEKSID